MKNQLVYLAAIFLITTTASAQSQEGTSLSVEHLGTIKVTGDFRTRFEESDGTDYTVANAAYPARVAATYLRVRPILNWSLNSDFGMVLQPQFAKAWGEPGTFARTATQQTSGSTNGDTAMTFHQAYGKWQPISWLDFKAGRQVMEYGDQLMIGQSDWTNISRSFDVLRMHATYNIGPHAVWSDVFASKIDDSLAATAGTGDTDFYGIYNSASFGPYAQTVDVYLLENRNNTVAGPTQTIRAFGARAKSAIGTTPFDYRAEWTRENNDNVNSGYQYNLEAGYSMDNAIHPHFSVEYYYASTDFNQLYMSSHSFLGYADILGRRNLKGFALHATGKTGLANLSAQVDFYTFDRADTTAPVYNKAGTTKIGVGNETTSSDLGKELDLTLRYQWEKELMFAVGYSRMSSGEYEKQVKNGDDTNPQYVYAQMEARY